MYGSTKPISVFSILFSKTSLFILLNAGKSILDFNVLESLVVKQKTLRTHQRCGVGGEANAEPDSM